MRQDEAGINALIGQLYEVALDPGKYEAMLDEWDRVLAHNGAQPEALGHIPALPGTTIPDQAPSPGTSDSGPPAPSATGPTGDPAGPAPPGLTGDAHLSWLADHIARADRLLSQSMEPQGDTGAEVTTGAISRAAAFTLNARGEIGAVNAATSRMLGLTSGGRITDLPLAAGELEKLLEATRTLLNAPSPSRRILCLRAQGTGRLIVLKLRDFRPPDGPAFVRCVTSEISFPAGFRDVMEQSFGLSRAETEVLRLLAEGYSTADIAALRGRSPETIRVQLRSLNARTDTHSQAELIRLALTTVGALRADAPASEDDGCTLNDITPATVTLPGGRQMDYLTLGDPAGRPVLYLPMDLGLTRLPPAAEAEALRRGLRLIVPVRAGYGGSSPVPARRDYLAQLVSDHLALLDHLRLTRLALVTLGDDSLLGMRLIAAQPGRFATLIAAAGTLPMLRPEQLIRMGKWHRFILSGATRTPHLLPFMVHAAAAMTRRYGKPRFLQSVYSASAADMATCAIPEVRLAITRGSEVLLSDTHSAHEAFAAEHIARAQADWTRPLAQLQQAVADGQCRVIFFNGRQDPQIPPETLEEMQLDHPWIEFRLYPDAGQLIAFLKWRDLLALLDSLTGAARA